MTTLPPNWAEAPLHRLAKVAYGKGLPKGRRGEAGAYPYVGSGGVIAQTFDCLVDGPALVIGRKGTAGSVQRFEHGCWPSDTTFFIRVPDELDATLLEHQLRCLQLGQYDRSTALPGLGRPDLEAARIVVPPLAEQRRIVTAIEEAFSRLDAGEIGLRTARTLLKRMRSSVLAAAVTGRLVPQEPTDTSAADHLAEGGIEALELTDQLPRGWARVVLGNLARVGSGTTPSRANSAFWRDGSIPWVTSALLNEGVVRQAREYVTPAAVAETALKLWPAGSLLIAMYGEGQTRGRCAELALEATCNQACAAIVLHDSVAPFSRFVRIFLDANYEANRRLAAGGVQPNLSVGLVKSMAIPIPPIDEARRIVDEVDRQFSFLNACDRAVNLAGARSTRLRRSILKAAFEGRLVSQEAS